MTAMEKQSHRSSSLTDTLAHWVEKKISSIDEEIQRDLSEFGRSMSDLPCEDDGSIASEVDNLYAFQESIRSELQRLDGLTRWKGPTEAKRVVERFLAGKDVLRSLPSMESASSEDTSEESISENSEEFLHSESSKVPNEIPSIEATLSTLLAQYRGFGKASLALACDFLAPHFLDSSPSPILLPWVRHQLDLSHPPSILDGTWLFRVPLLGNVARGAHAETFSVTTLISQVHEGEIQEIDEDGISD